jgi:S1-C subfamily serine protease
VTRVAVTNPPGDRITDRPTQTLPSVRPEEVARRLLPRSVLGITAVILAFSMGASLAGVVLYSYYAYRLSQNESRVNKFVSGFGDTVSKAEGSIKSAQDSATKEIQRQLAPLEQIAAEGGTLQALITKSQPALYFVHTLDESGAPSVGSAFSVASDTHQTLLLTSYTTVRAATHRPGPDVFVRHGGTETKVQVYTWQEERDLALLILSVGNQAKLDFAADPPTIGERVFALSGLGSQGGAISQGFVADVSSAGIQHDAPVGPSFQGGPLVDSNGKVLGISSRAYAPLGFSTDAVWFAVPGRAACEKVLSCPNNTPVGAGSQTATSTG